MHEARICKRHLGYTGNELRTSKRSWTGYGRWVIPRSTFRSAVFINIAHFLICRNFRFDITHKLDCKVSDNSLRYRYAAHFMLVLASDHACIDFSTAA
jgi:hypothetical protein